MQSRQQPLRPYCPNIYTVLGSRHPWMEIGKISTSTPNCSYQRLISIWIWKNNRLIYSLPLLVTWFEKIPSSIKFKVWAFKELFFQKCSLIHDNHSISKVSSVASYCCFCHVRQTALVALYTAVSHAHFDLWVSWSPGSKLLIIP